MTRNRQDTTITTTASPSLESLDHSRFQSIDTPIQAQPQGSHPPPSPERDPYAPALMYLNLQAFEKGRWSTSSRAESRPHYQHVASMVGRTVTRRRSISFTTPAKGVWQSEALVNRAPRWTLASKRQPVSSAASDFSTRRQQGAVLVPPETTNPHDNSSQYQRPEGSSPREDYMDPFAPAHKYLNLGVQGGASLGSSDTSAISRWRTVRRVITSYLGPHQHRS